MPPFVPRRPDVMTTDVLVALRYALDLAIEASGENALDTTRDVA